MQSVTLLRLKQLQTQECLEVLPTVVWTTTFIHEHSTQFIAGMLTLNKKHGFSFITPPEYINHIQSHSLTIRALFNDNKLFKKMKISLLKRNLLYIEQLLTIDGSHLLFWADLRFTTFSQGLQSTCIPQW